MAARPAAVAACLCDDATDLTARSEAAEIQPQIHALTTSGTNPRVVGSGSLPATRAGEARLT